MNPASENDLSPVQRSLLDQAADWRLLALLFECPNPRWREFVSALGSATSDNALRAAADAALEEADEGLYYSVFGPGGPAPSREVSYHDSLQLGYLMSELEATYSAFAYRPALQEAPDHVALEIGFVAYLRCKEAYALGQSQSDAAAIAADAAQQFLANHLAVMAQPLSKLLARSGVRYLELAGAALLARVGPSKTFPMFHTPWEAGDCEDECGRLSDS